MANSKQKKDRIPHKAFAFMVANTHAYIKDLKAQGHKELAKDLQQLLKVTPRTAAGAAALTARIISTGLLAEGEKKYMHEPLPDPEPFALILNDIKLIKLSTFIKCYVHADFTGLILAGEPTERQISDVWEVITAQYYEASGNTMAIAENAKEMTAAGYYLFESRVKTNISAIRKILSVTDLNIGIRLSLAAPLFDDLRVDGYDYEYSVESLFNDLVMIETELIGFETKREELQEEIKRVREKARNKEITIDEDFFLAQLAELRKFEGFPQPVTVLAEKMTVYDYCISLKRYSDHVDFVNSQNKGEDGNG